MYVQHTILYTYTCILMLILNTFFECLYIFVFGYRKLINKQYNSAKRGRLTGTLPMPGTNVFFNFFNLIEKCLQECKNIKTTNASVIDKY